MLCRFVAVPLSNLFLTESRGLFKHVFRISQSWHSFGAQVLFKKLSGKLNFHCFLSLFIFSSCSKALIKVVSSSNEKEVVEIFNILLKDSQHLNRIYLVDSLVNLYGLTSLQVNSFSFNFSNIFSEKPTNTLGLF